MVSKDSAERLLSWLQTTETRWPWERFEFICRFQAGLGPLGVRAANSSLPAIQNKAHCSKQSAQTHHRHPWEAGMGNHSGNFNGILPFAEDSPGTGQCGQTPSHRADFKIRYLFWAWLWNRMNRDCKIQPVPRNDWHLWLNSLPTLLRVAWQQYLCNAEEPALLIRSSMAGMIAASCPPLLCRYTPSQQNSISTYRRCQCVFPKAGGSIHAGKHLDWPAEIWNKPALTSAPTSKSHLCHK